MRPPVTTSPPREGNFRIPGAYFSRNTQNAKFRAGVLRGSREILNFFKIPGPNCVISRPRRERNPREFTRNDQNQRFSNESVGISRKLKINFRKISKTTKNAFGNATQCRFQMKRVTLSKTQKSTI